MVDSVENYVCPGCKNVFEPSTEDIANPKAECPDCGAEVEKIDANKKWACSSCGTEHNVPDEAEECCEDDEDKET